MANTDEMTEIPLPVSDRPDEAALRSSGSFRWTICGLLFLATMVNYIDRQVIGILKPQLSHELGWTEQGYADIVTAFQFAYAFGYLFAGRFIDWIGVKRGLPLAVTLWSLAAA